MNLGFPGSLTRKSAHITTSAGITSWHGRWAAFQSRKMFWVYVLLYPKWFWMLDDSIKSEEDVEKYLGLVVLASLPDYRGIKQKKKIRDKDGKQ